MVTIDNNIETFEAMRSDLETHHAGEWVLIYDQEVIAFFKAFDEAAEAAVQQFGRGPYLIRQIGAPPVVLPASVMYHPLHG
jgi:hypothetical protein